MINFYEKFLLSILNLKLSNYIAEKKIFHLFYKIKVFNVVY